MIRDFHEHADGATIEADLCIVGAGAAGITLAHELRNSRRRVLLVESGGLDADAATQELYAGENVGMPYPPLDTARLRFFGGTTNHWDGHCAPLDAIDFEKRRWVPHSGWPLTRADLAPAYERAQVMCELGPCEYRPERWGDALPGLIDFESRRLVNRLWQFGPPTRFGRHYRDALNDAANVEVLLNANVVEIVVNDEATAVRKLRLRSLEGRSGAIRPRTVVVACGGIENARLLLASDRVMKNGLGNANDLVGRFFQEHPHAIFAFAVPAVPIDRLGVYYGNFAARGEAGAAVFQAKPGLSEDIQRREGLLNCCIDVGWGYQRSPGYLKFRAVAKSLAQGRMPRDLGHAVLTMAGDLGGLAEGLYRRARDQNVFWFACSVEQAPNPDSRVTLAAERDALGLPRVRLDWRLSPLDKITARRACRLVGEEFARLGLGRMRLDDWLLADDTTWQDMDVRYHHMGTTRMSDDPKRGVVDRHCRVHGIDNLYVAGSSVFPTSGYANPTLTIVAMAVRLADHLTDRLADRLGGGNGG
ncbi:MAG: GMC family oxidoreductase [Alphaproteobacteria bacterium]|nr:GMC family oxidoreductase [Alphaproteobacteria bacterium]